MSKEARIATLALDSGELSRPVTREGDGVDPADEKHHERQIDHVEQVSDIPLKYRLMALSCILFFTTGSAFAESTLGPLKSTFVRELKINSEWMSAALPAADEKMPSLPRSALPATSSTRFCP
jgi:hypothetical protein